MTLGLTAVLGLWMIPAAPALDGDCDKDDDGALLADCTCDGECDGSCKDGGDEAEILLADCSCGKEGCDGSCKDGEDGAELLA